MFVNREKELKILENEYNRDGFKFCIIYGRRRVGKTTLIRKFLKNKKHIYFLATLENEKILLEKFKEIVAESLEDEFLKGINLTSFESIFKYIARKKEKLVVVIDEFQYLSKVNLAIASIFQSIAENLNTELPKNIFFFQRKDLKKGLKRLQKGTV
ncbi:AAA family ATPase [Hippea alviniae]|uniref:AAA family ATPase n=1 Tax=Hippea alviniae TaxID=1279027 RepID=UPI0003B79F7E|nr:ATP-binding protein [Hippea alviniae]